MTAPMKPTTRYVVRLTGREILCIEGLLRAERERNPPQPTDDAFARYEKGDLDTALAALADVLRQLDHVPGDG